jgi:hypothetical protein
MTHTAHSANPLFSHCPSSVPSLTHPPLFAIKAHKAAPCNHTPRAANTLAPHSYIAGKPAPHHASPFFTFTPPRTRFRSAEPVASIVRKRPLRQRRRKSEEWTLFAPESWPFRGTPISLRLRSWATSSALATWFERTHYPHSAVALQAALPKFTHGESRDLRQ